MYIRNSNRYNKPLKIIHPGEYYVTDRDEMIGTLLGSCVSVCLLDEANGVGGMNHFMLPGRISSVDIFSDRSARYGITAINQLIMSMTEAGASKKNMIAKIFGGGHVLDITGSTESIPLDNIRVARVMMEFEDISIVTSDVGENYTRKILMDVKSGRVYLKKSARQEVIDNVVREEQAFARRKFHEG